MNGVPPEQQTELRWDRGSSSWVIVAAGRRRRPHAGARGPEPCPFCAGQEARTPPETLVIPGQDGRWQVRVVGNPHPLLTPTDLPPPDHGEGFETAPGRGIHEVVVESPRHDWDFATGTTAEVTDVLRAWQARILALRKRAAVVTVFRNHGAASGTSLDHPHSQIVAASIVPRSTSRWLAVQQRHYKQGGRCLAVDMLEDELRSGRRILRASKHCVSFVPFASSTSFAVRILPRVQRPDFATIPGAELKAVAKSLRLVLAALAEELDEPAYNLLVHTTPTGWELAPFLCWSIDILPRIDTVAGFELATGVPVVTVPPEEVATRLLARLTTTRIDPNPRPLRVV